MALSPSAKLASLSWYRDTDVINNNFDEWNNRKDIKAADTSDQLNLWRSERSNYFNEQQWQAENAWNLYTWELENEYNSPASQVSRLLDAGINPLWAMSNGDTGHASQLTSAASPGTNYPTATNDMAKLLNDRIISTEQNALNGVLGFGNLDLGYRRLNLDTHISKSAIRKTQAETDLIKSQLESNEFINRINKDTYSTQVSLKTAELQKCSEEIERLKSETSLTDAQKQFLSVQEDKEKALKLQIEAATKKIASETFDQIDNLQYRWYEAQTARISANASQTSADAAVMNAQTADAQLNHLIEKDTNEFELKSNEQILAIIDSQRGFIDRALGTPSNFFGALTGGKDFDMVNRVLAQLKAGMNVISRRAYSNPTKSNLDAVDEMSKRITNFQNQRISVPGVIPTSPATSSVLNPSQSWQGQ